MQLKYREFQFIQINEILNLVHIQIHNIEKILASDKTPDRDGQKLHNTSIKNKLFLIFIYFISHIKFDIFIFISKELLHLAKTVIDVPHFKLKMVQFIFINLLPMQMRLRHII